MTSLPASNRVRVPSLVLFGLLSVGCSSGPNDTPNVGEVTGTVTFEGDPLAGATVTFDPDEGRQSTATTDEQGRYVLRYSEKLKGAKIGKHTVKISKTEEVRDADGELVSAKETLPATYNTQSNLDRVVKAGAQVMNFDLKADGT